MDMGNPSSRLSRALQLPFDSAIVGSGAPGGPVPQSMDVSAVIPTWDVGQLGMLDPHPSDISIPNKAFTTQVHFSGAMAGRANRAGRIVAPAGFANPFGAAAIPSVNNNIPTRLHNSLIQCIGGYIEFDAAGAVAFNGKYVDFIVYMTQVNDYATYADWSVIKLDSLLVATGNLTNYIGVQCKILVPWDCVAMLYINVRDNTNFPANTSLSFSALVHTRNKNQSMPQW